MQRPSLIHTAQPLLRFAVPHSSRTWFSTSLRLAIDQRRVAGKIQIRTLEDKIAELPGLNNKIRGRYARVKGADGTLSEEQPLAQLLALISPPNQYLLQVNKVEGDQVPIVQFVTRKDVVQRINRQADQLEHHRRLERQSKPKQLELNWAIDPNDLQLKMKQMNESLQKGKKVELLLANKRHQRKASPEEARTLLQTVRQKIEDAGAVEVMAPAGEVLKRLQLTVKLRGT